VKDEVSNMISGSPVSNYNGGQPNSKFQAPHAGASPNLGRFGFIRNLTSIYGFRRASPNKRNSVNNVEFLKVDQNSDLRLAQAKIGRTFSTKLSGKLEELFNSWLRDTTDTYKILEDRNRRISELEFAITNDPFLSMASDMYADEATQIDVQGKLIQIDCADIRMKEKMEDLLEQWGITQNRLRSVACNLASYGDAFWSNKVTKNGVVRIVPIGIHQVKERLEFNPVQVQTDISLQKGYLTAINRSSKLQALFDTIEGEENEEFADLFDTRLFGFAIDDDMVVPPWAVSHFRLNVDQSEFAPMGRSLFLKALAPFRQCNATMVLQSLARVMSFPVTVYNVKTAPGMDEALQFDKINQIREEYELIGDSGAGTEAFSVNTKIWAPEGLLRLEMQTPDVDINATGDIEMYQDRVAVASGIPKGYLVQEWGGFGNSAISLVEQYKPFARRVFTIQSAILDGLSNLFRLHFAITGEYDYREPFILSMKFPNEETSDARQAAKQNSLNLSTQVLQTIAGIIGAINDPLPADVIQDILTKFSFLDPEDIKRWIKPNPNAKEHEEGQPPEEFGAGGGMGGGMGGAPMGGDMGMGAPPEGGEEMGAGAGGEMEAPPPAAGGAQGGNPLALDINGNNQNERIQRRKNYILNERKLKFQERQAVLLKRYYEFKDELQEKIIHQFERIDEAQMNNRHYKYARIESCLEPMYKLFCKEIEPVAALALQEEEITEDQKRVLEQKEHSRGILRTDDRKFTWKSIKEGLSIEEEVNTDDEEHFRRIHEIVD
jgi:hypothetical protein